MTEAATGSPADYAVGGIAPQSVVRPAGRLELAAWLAEQAAAGHAIVPRGLGTRMGLGAPPARLDAVVLTGGLDRVVAWEPGDLTVSVEAGVPLAELDRLLASRGQVLPLQSDRAGGTVGGLLAAGEDGCQALGAGRIRDLIIGASVALADGTIAKGRGAVVKNVAGYDVPRLLVGSLGTLGVVVEASFKLLPRPASRATVTGAFGSLGEAFAAAAAILDRNAIEPAFVNVLAGNGLVNGLANGFAANGLASGVQGSALNVRVAVGLQGSATRVNGSRETVTDLLHRSGARSIEPLEGADDAALRQVLDDPASSAGRAAPGTRSAVVKCLCLRSQQPALADALLRAGAPGASAVHLDARPGLGVLYVAVEAPPDPLADRVAALLRAARAEGRSAVLLAAPDPLRASLDVWGPPPADFFLMERIRNAVDPSGVFARGRFVGGL